MCSKIREMGLTPHKGLILYNILPVAAINVKLEDGRGFKTHGHTVSTETLPEAGKAERAHDSIVSPLVDFVMVGGITLLIIPLVLLPVWEGQNAEWLYLGSYYLIFVLNLPHFIHSYQLIYRRYGEKLFGEMYSHASRLRHFIAGIVAPLAMIAYFIYGTMQPTSDLLGYAVNIMLFLTGWHYVKQGYGVMITLGVRKKAFLDDIEKKILLANAYIAWIFAWIQVNSVLKDDMFQEIPFRTIGFPEEMMYLTQILFTCWTVGVFLFLMKRFDGNRPMSINGMTAYLTSLYPWVVFAHSHPHVIIFVPALHSAQYLLFVWKMVYERTKEEMMEKTGLKDVSVKSSDIVKKMVPFLGIGFGAGIVFFTWLPLMLDNMVTYNTAVFGSSLFVFLFLIFLNIHHYFIDFAIWRKENPEMRYLFK